ncbi:hypothetical protein SAMN05216328_12479 [Ensifer sp. YR511]|nr:hypothetical protein SAMN05216328_12479 [Ensifer sp. YR511]
MLGEQARGAINDFCVNFRSGRSRHQENAIWLKQGSQIWRYKTGYATSPRAFKSAIYCRCGALGNCWQSTGCTALSKRRLVFVRPATKRRAVPALSDGAFRVTSSCERSVAYERPAIIQQYLCDQQLATWRAGKATHLTHRTVLSCSTLTFMSGFRYGGTSNPADFARYVRASTKAQKSADEDPPPEGQPIPYPTVSSNTRLGRTTCKPQLADLLSY